MTCAVLSIGTELTRGELVNSNVAWLSEELTAIGFELIEQVVVDDDRSRIRDAVLRLAAKTQVVVCTGGLGPTTDDVTTDAVAAALGVSLIRDAPSLENIRRRLRETEGRTMEPDQRKAGRLPGRRGDLAQPRRNGARFRGTRGRLRRLLPPRRAARE